MVSINGIELRLQTRPEITSEHNQERTPLPGSDGCHIDDMGYNGLQIRIRGYETALDRYETIIAEFMATGEQELILRDGWKYKVYSNRYNLAPNNDDDAYFTYEFLLFTANPYQYSEDTRTLSKTITANNQEWSADDSGTEITTGGTVAAKPDIQLTAGAGSGYGGIGEEDEQYDGTYHETTSGSYVLASTLTHSALAGKALQILEVKSDFSQTATVNRRVWYKWTAQATSYNGGEETIIASGYVDVNVNTGWTTVTKDVSGNSVIAGHNEDFVVRLYWYKNVSYSDTAKQQDHYSTAQELLLTILDDVQVYNTADSTVKCDVCGLIHPGTVVRINANNTGTFRYSDDFSTDAFYYHTFKYVNATHDDENDEADITASGYLEYRFDTKLPITGIPVLTALIDLTTGTGTKIQIADDDDGAPGTYYDIDTAIVDNVSTGYELNNATGLQLKGKTKFWLKIVCDGSSACSVKSIQLDIDMVTETAENPIINTGAANTFRCDQSSGSSVDCTVDLIYEDRKWAS